MHPPRYRKNLFSTAPHPIIAPPPQRAPHISALSSHASGQAVDLGGSADVLARQDASHLADDGRVRVAESVELGDAALGRAGWNGGQQPSRGLDDGGEGRGASER